MAGVRYDINLDQGTNFTFRFKLMSEDAEGVRTPWDLTNLVFTFKSQDSSHLDAIFQETILTVVEDYVILALTPEQTNLYTTRKTYFYTVDVDYPSGEKKRLLKGLIIASHLVVY